MCWGERGGAGGARLGIVIQHEPDDGDGVAVNVLRDDPGILLEADLSETVEEMTVHCLRRLIRILWLRRLEVGDTLLEVGVGEA